MEIDAEKLEIYFIDNKKEVNKDIKNRIYNDWIKEWNLFYIDQVDADNSQGISSNDYIYCDYIIAIYYNKSFCGAILGTLLNKEEISSYDHSYFYNFNSCDLEKVRELDDSKNYFCLLHKLIVGKACRGKEISFEMEQFGMNRIKSWRDLVIYFATILSSSIDKFDVSIGQINLTAKMDRMKSICGEGKTINDNIEYTFKGNGSFKSQIILFNKNESNIVLKKHFEQKFHYLINQQVRKNFEYENRLIDFTEIPQGGDMSSIKSEEVKGKVNNKLDKLKKLRRRNGR